MSIGTEGMSPADFAAITNNEGFGGGNGAWWLLVLLLFGWGRGGYGYGGGDGGVQTNYVLTSDFAQVERKLDSITNGICDSAYTNAQLINGLQVGQMQSANAIQSQLAQCCCDTKQGLAETNYNIATQSCGIQRTIENGTRDILENQNANTRAILDKLCQQETEALKARISEQQQTISGLQLAASQSAQNQYLIQQLRPTPVAAYQVPNPYTGCGCGC